MSKQRKELKKYKVLKKHLVDAMVKRITKLQKETE